MLDPKPNVSVGNTAGDDELANALEVNQFGFPQGLPADPHTSRTGRSVEDSQLPTELDEDPMARNEYGFPVGLRRLNVR